MAQPCDDIGRQAAALLIERIGAPEACRATRSVSTPTLARARILRERRHERAAAFHDRGVSSASAACRRCAASISICKAGEIHALLGENGAGKSTLMNILSGVFAPDEGTIRIDGAPVRFANPREAQAAGIATIFQELDLVPSLDVAANLFLGRELMRPGGCLDVAAMRREARKRLEAIELDIDRRPAGRRSLDRAAAGRGHRQGAVLRVAHPDHGRADRGADGRRRSIACSRIMRELSASGVGIVYISHRLEEVPQIADRVTVMRDGRVAGVTAPRRAAGGACAAAGRPAAGRALSAARGGRRQGRAAPARRAASGRRARARRLAGAGGRLASTCMRARSSAWPASWAPAAPSC